MILYGLQEDQQKYQLLRRISQGRQIIREFLLKLNHYSVTFVSFVSYFDLANGLVILPRKKNRVMFG